MFPPRVALPGVVRRSRFAPRLGYQTTPLTWNLFARNGLSKRWGAGTRETGSRRPPAAVTPEQALIPRRSPCRPPGAQAAWRLVCVMPFVLCESADERL